MAESIADRCRDRLAGFLPSKRLFCGKSAPQGLSMGRMQSDPPTFHPYDWLMWPAWVGVVLFTTACATQEKGADMAEPIPLPMLLSMTWAEAKTLSDESMEVENVARIAADSIHVLKADAEGRPIKLRARGRVFVESLEGESAVILCQEAFVDRDELILRGKPLLQRGETVLEGLDDLTVYYMVGSRLRVLGRHRIVEKSTLVQEWAEEEPIAPSHSRQRGLASLPSASPALPVRGPWAAGPNPLLPALSPSSIPESVRIQMHREAETTPVISLDSEQNSPAIETDSSLPTDE